MSMRFLSVLLISAVCAFGAGELSGRRAPGFSLPDSAGKQHDPLDYRGKVLIIDFMQVSCEHCVKFSAILEQARIRYGDRIAILSVVNPPSDQKGVADYMASGKIKSPILFDCGQVSSSYYKASPQHSEINVPHLFIIDGRGVIQNDYAYSVLTKGIFEDRDLFGELDRMLAKTK